MNRSFKTGAIAMLLAGLLIFSAACTPAQESQILGDIQAVVSLSGTVLSVVQSFGALTSPQQSADVNTAENLAQEYSAAASEGITEFNSADAWSVKVAKITSMFTAIAPIPAVQTARINAAVKLMSAAVQLLIAQLQGSAPAALPASARTVKTEVKAVPAWFAGMIPGTLHHRLKSIQKQADANVALAARLKAAHSLR